MEQVLRENLQENSHFQTDNTQPEDGEEFEDVDEDELEGAFWGAVKVCGCFLNPCGTSSTRVYEGGWVGLGW